MKDKFIARSKEDPSKLYKFNTDTQNFEFYKKEKFVKKQPLTRFEESKEVKFEKVYAQVTNRLYELFSQYEKVEMKKVEQIVIEELFEKFNRTELSKIIGLSVRAIRYKLNGYKDL